MKKKYSKPEMQVVYIRRHAPLLAGSPYELNGNEDEYYELGYIPGITDGMSHLA